MVVGGLLILFSIWWTYFERPPDRMLDRLPSTFAWAYLHLVAFAAAAAVRAGMVVAVEATGGHAQLAHAAVAATDREPSLFRLGELAAEIGAVHDQSRRLRLVFEFLRAAAENRPPARLLVGAQAGADGRSAVRRAAGRDR